MRDQVWSFLRPTVKQLVSHNVQVKIACVLAHNVVVVVVFMTPSALPTLAHTGHGSFLCYPTTIYIRSA